MESLRESILEKAKHKQEYDSRMNERQMQSKEGKVDSSKALDVDLVVTKSSGTESEKHNTSSRFRNDTHAEDADIKPGNDKESMVEVQLTAKNNVLAKEQQYFMQSEPIYDRYLLEKVDSNITPDSTNMGHREGEIDQNAKKCQVSCPLLAPSFDNMTTKFSNQSLENSSKESYGSNDMVHNYYQEEARKKTQDQNRILKPMKMPSARTHHTLNACTPKPRSNNQTSRNWPTSKRVRKR
uniref:Uncharacterized protein n=1 Tax=Tanacetum cinerariifolium TaxID=118510 RepID=A0A6L2LBD0_TANCI|nr:hypothetical protein [Tanacetum cinerariifolium]